MNLFRYLILLGLVALNASSSVAQLRRVTAFAYGKSASSEVNPPTQYAIIDLGESSPIGGIFGGLTNSGYVLLSHEGQASVWYRGEFTPLEGGSPQLINETGTVVGSGPLEGVYNYNPWSSDPFYAGAPGSAQPVKWSAGQSTATPVAFPIEDFTIVGASPPTYSGQVGRGEVSGFDDYGHLYGAALDYAERAAYTDPNGDFHPTAWGLVLTGYDFTKQARLGQRALVYRDGEFVAEGQDERVFRARGGSVISYDPLSWEFFLNGVPIEQILPSSPSMDYVVPVNLSSHGMALLEKGMNDSPYIRYFICDSDGSNLKDLRVSPPIGGVLVSEHAMALNYRSITAPAPSGGTEERVSPQVVGQSYLTPWSTDYKAAIWEEDPNSGNYFKRYLDSMVPLDSGWRLKNALDINDNGVILCQYEFFAGFPNELRDGMCLLVPVEVEIRTHGEQAAPETGLLVKNGDVLEFALAPQFFGTEDTFQNLITWQYRQLKGDGSYTDWADFGPHGKGTKFEHTTAAGGVFQVKAIIVNGGEHQYKRKKDAPHCTDSGGTYNEYYRRGNPDFVGVADADWQIATRREAHSNLGSTVYATSATLILYQGGPTLEIGINKCNAFVYHKAGDGGAPVPLIHTGGNPFDNDFFPPVAYDWWEAVMAIPNWSRLQDSLYPQPGYIVAGPDEEANGTSQRWGHVGILDYDGGWIQAGRDTVNKNPHLTTSQSMPYQPAAFRKYLGQP